MPDFLITEHGTVAQIEPANDYARQWIDDNVSSEPWQWLGRTLVIEPRYLPHLVSGMIDAGFSVADR